VTLQRARDRVQSLLVTVFNKEDLGAEVYLLACLGIMMTKWSTVNPLDALSEIRTWRRGVDLPYGLHDIATDYVNKNLNVFSTFKR
jgi:hypothetical protein